MHTEAEQKEYEKGKTVVVRADTSAEQFNLFETRESYGIEAGLLYKEESYQIMGGYFAVYKDKGCGFLEAVYQECLEIELEARQVPYIPQPTLTLTYRGRPLQQIYQPDLVCYDRIIVELKAVVALTPEHRAQLINYLRATRMELGLLVNFGHYPKIEYERIICQADRYSKT